MSSPPPGQTDADGREALLNALEVPRNARLALVVGVVLSLAVTLLFLGLHAGGRLRQPLPYYLGLTFVVFVSTTILAASVLTGRRALALTVHPASLVRRGASVGLLGGLAWLGAAAALAFVAGGAVTSGAVTSGAVTSGVVTSGTSGAGTGADSTAAAVAGFVLPWAPLLSLGGAWAVHTRYKRSTPIRPVALAAGPVLVPGALVIADLAALDLSLLLSRPWPTYTIVPALFLVGAGLFVFGHALQAWAALLASPTALSAFYGIGPLLGFGALLVLGPGAPGIAIFAGLTGIATTAVCWSLRSVSDGDVPTGPDH